MTQDMNKFVVKAIASKNGRHETNALRPRILAIDDTPTNLHTLAAALSADYDLQVATSGPMGLTLALASPPALILLDVMMPGMDGFTTRQRLQSEPGLKDVPLIFITAMNDPDSEMRGLALGAADYITKPINVDSARLRIRNLLEREHLRKEIEMQRSLLEARVVEQKSAQIKLEDSEARFRSLFEKSSSVMLLIDPASGAIVDANPAAAAFYGYVRTQMIGMPHKNINSLPPENLAEARKMAVCEERIAFTFQHRLASGEMRDVEVHSSPIESAGQPLLFSIIHDITQRKQAEAALRIAATAFEAQVGIVVTDASGVILRVNRALTEETGYSTEELVGQTPRVFKSGRHDAAFYAAMWEKIRGTGVWAGEIWDRRKNGETYPKWMSIAAVKGEEGQVSHYVSSQTDITERKTAEQEIKNLAFYDPLTGLPNRRLLVDRLRLSLATSERSQHHGALLFIDLDNFKTLNDTLGHGRGDELLQQVAKRLLSCVRESDTVARLGGDEFVIMLEGLGGEINEAAAMAETIGEKVLAALNRTYWLNGDEIRSTPSIGITMFGSQQQTIDEFLKQADLAMYQAKAAGRNTLRFYDPQMQAAVNARAALEADLRNAVREGQFIVHYQAQVEDDELISGAEVLVRWQDPQRGIVAPDIFIPLAEETGLILPLGQWVLETACSQLAAWATRADTIHLTLAVNVSVRQLRQPDFVEQVLSTLKRTGADPRKLKLELTESQLMDNVENTITKMRALKSVGVGFALDDFGTGYSSLSYLKRLPLEKLKIDRSFVRDILTDHNDAAIARTIVALAESLGLAVIAEGVETAAQRDCLARHGCSAYQGYLFSRPLPLEAFEALLSQPLHPSTAGTRKRYSACL